MPIYRKDAPEDDPVLVHGTNNSPSAEQKPTAPQAGEATPDDLKPKRKTKTAKKEGK